MPWAQTSAMDERVRFIADHRSGLYTMAEPQQMSDRVAAASGRTTPPPHLGARKMLAWLQARAPELELPAP